jgi:hypothetical protein
MADLGAIAFGLGSYPVRIPDAMPTFHLARAAAGYAAYFAAVARAVSFSLPDAGITDGQNVGLKRTTTLKTISGTTKESATGVSRRVRIYERESGALVYDGVSSGAGVFSAAIYGNTLEHTVIAYDDITSGADYNAVVFDRIIPG